MHKPQGIHTGIADWKYCGDTVIPYGLQLHQKPIKSAKAQQLARQMCWRLRCVSTDQCCYCTTNRHWYRRRISVAAGGLSAARGRRRAAAHASLAAATVVRLAWLAANDLAASRWWLTLLSNRCIRLSLTKLAQETLGFSEVQWTNVTSSWYDELYLLTGGNEKIEFTLFLFVSHSSSACMFLMDVSIVI